jgi:hypothetical protein
MSYGLFFCSDGVAGHARAWLRFFLFFEVVRVSLERVVTEIAKRERDIPESLTIAHLLQAQHGLHLFRRHGSNLYQEIADTVSHDFFLHTSADIVLVNCHNNQEVRLKQGRILSPRWIWFLDFACNCTFTCMKKKTNA